MSQLKITCPNCNKTFSEDQASQKYLKEKYQKEYKVREKLLEEKYKLFLKLKKSPWYENIIFRNYNHEYILHTQKM